jgi:hypothetical protein
MAYSKIGWTAREGVDLNKYTKSSETSGSVILTNSPTDITVAGTPFTAANMSHMDDGIEANDTAITTEIADREAAITAEASTRSSADTTLQSNIDAVDAAAVHKTGAETITGSKTFSDTVALPAGATIPVAAATDGDTATVSTAAVLDNLESALTAVRSLVGSIYSNLVSTWYNVISVRHKNGFDDGSQYGMQIHSQMTQGSDLSWRQQIAGAWQAEKKLIDSANYKAVMAFDASPTDGSTNLVNSNAVYDAVTSEASTRASADATLQSNIDAEASTRSSADTTLQSNIDAEASTRASADATLQSNIDAVSTTITGELPASGNAGTITASDLYTTLGALVPDVGNKARINGGINEAGLSGGVGDNSNINLASVRRISSTTIRLSGIGYFNANDGSGSYSGGGTNRDITSSTTGSCTGYINW